MSDLNKLKNALTEISVRSPNYPIEWKQLSSPTETLYALGDISLLQERKFAVVGSRRTPANALTLGREISQRLSREFVLVTGTADGGDTAAIEGGLAGDGRLVCLLAGGFSALPQANLPLLRRVARQGLLLSYQPFETPVRTFSYEERNKRIATLSEGVLVLGAGEKSGALITAKYAAAQNKPLFALPYPPNAVSGVGCNRLIKEGAYLTENAADILEKFGLNAKEERKSFSLSPDEEKVYKALQDAVEAHASALAQQTGIPAFKLRGVLSALEVKGAVVALGGNRFTIV